MKKRKAFLVVELDNDELSILPPHLHGLLSRPLVGPVQTRKADPHGWMNRDSPAAKREREVAEHREQGRKALAEKIRRGELDAPEKT